MVIMGGLQKRASKPERPLLGETRPSNFPLGFCLDELDAAHLSINPSNNNNKKASKTGSIKTHLTNKVKQANKINNKQAKA